MILARLKESVRNQDWFAVALELVIVVLGIVLGLAVAEWVEDQKQRGTERDILERLHGEVAELVELRDAFYQGRVARLEQVQEARALIYFDDPSMEISWEHCRAIVSSHVHPLAADTVPTLEDLIATGRLDFVRDADLRRAISAFLLERDNARNYAAMTRELTHQLASQHSDLIRQGLRPSADPTNRHGADREYECDWPGMRVDDAFRNDFMENSERYADFTEFAMRILNVRLGELDRALELALGKRDDGAGD